MVRRSSGSGSDSAESLAELCPGRGTGCSGPWRSLLCLNRPPARRPGSRCICCTSRSLLPAWTTRHYTLRSQFLLNLIRSQQHMRITCFPSQWAAYSQIAFLDILHITRCLELAYVCFLRTENSRFRLFSHYLNQGHKHICLNHYLINLMHNDLY